MTIAHGPLLLLPRLGSMSRVSLAIGSAGPGRPSGRVRSAWTWCAGGSGRRGAMRLSLPSVCEDRARGPDWREGGRGGVQRVPGGAGRLERGWPGHGKGRKQGRKPADLFTETFPLIGPLLRNPPLPGEGTATWIGTCGGPGWSCATPAGQRQREWRGRDAIIT